MGGPGLNYAVLIFNHVNPSVFLVIFHSCCLKIIKCVFEGAISLITKVSLIRLTGRFGLNLNSTILGYQQYA